MIPLLLPSKHAGAQNIISLLGECCSAKEVVIAVQEAVERLQMSLSTESDEEEEEDVQSYAVMLGILISLYSSGMFNGSLTNFSSLDCYSYTTVKTT